MRIKSDHYKNYAEEMNERFGDFFGPELVPVDLYGKRVNLNKNDPTNMEKTAEDIKEFYGLDD